MTIRPEISTKVQHSPDSRGFIDKLNISDAQRPYSAKNDSWSFNLKKNSCNYVLRQSIEQIKSFDYVKQFESELSEKFTEKKSISENVVEQKQTKDENISNNLQQ